MLVFKLENLIHRKDKGRNTNYHIAAFDSYEVDGFIKYLFYNGAIHVRNIIFLTLLFLVRYLVFKWVSPFDIVLWLLFIKDCYCVMLQRYNYLRIKICNERLTEKREQRIEKRAQKILANAQGTVDIEQAKADLEFVRQFGKSLSERDCVVISEKDIETLNRLRDLLAVGNIKESVG